ncbi:hypothetical protein FIA58_015555 [Flavobacterium jejuense]|uniref:Uncharacterized protein n=1 Tax=Flavobacterium jejuense TaxID=1544455 RepID=A0ABX0IZC1_9FLAO|nr:contractile injection system tape measure protein [Flavobacterium jejuense]NHN27099.1 hypothetical protein [Flavobacterium jejuense]
MHLLQQHTFDIHCSSQAFGKELHSQLSLLLEKEFYPKLEVLFNKYDIKNKVWVIDTLSIEIPNVSKKYWKTEIIQKGLTQIEDYLRKNRISYSENRNDEMINSNSFFSNSTHSECIFLNFLKTGRIIENTISKNLEEIILKIEVTEVFIERLLLNLETNQNCLIRWIFSVPDFFKEIVFRKLNNFPNEIAVFLNKILDINDKGNHETKQIIKKITKNSLLKKQWIELIQWMNYFQKRSVSKVTLVKEFIQFSKEFWEITTHDLSLICQYIYEISSNSSDTITTEIKDFFSKVENSILKNSIQENKFKTLENSSLQEGNLALKNGKNDTDLGKAQYINNAGLVLLHPFLKALFEQLNLCESNGNWTKKISQHKAILLTQFLVFGEEKINESDLVLNKILCGFPIEAVVNVKLKMTKEEKDKCKSLLEAVNEHWKVMNKSSIEALQQTFLQREAKLEFVSEDEFELWVEEKGYDILLEQLPWGIGMIQTPWMENYLNCHWS